MKPTTWTLCIDESGRFDGAKVRGDAAERVALIVGGVVCPGSAGELDLAWRDGLTRGCTALGVEYPPHATDNADQAVGLQRLAAEQVAIKGGTWIFVASEPPEKDSIQNDLVRFARMLGELTDVAARYVASQGGRELEVRPAQRTVPVTREALKQAKRLGLGTVEFEDGEKLRTHAAAEVRQALDALGREEQGALAPYPTLASIEVRTADSSSTHCGVFLADIGCNALYRRLALDWDSDTAAIEDCLGAGRVLVLAGNGLRRLREVDRALREQPSDLVRAAGAVTWLEGHAQGASTQVSRFPMARQGLARMARSLWQESCRSLFKQQRASPQEIAKLLAGTADARLSAKTGAYEGTWLALDQAWAGDGAFAHGMRGGVEDRELHGQLWRLVVECANHRGDVVSAEAAVKAFDGVLTLGKSYALLAEELHVRNLAVVALQNRLPAEEETLQETQDRLRVATEQLLRANQDAVSWMEMEGNAPPSPERLSSATFGDEERALWLATTGKAPSFGAPDRELGRRFGTAAQTYGFLGELDKALELAMRARSYFGASKFDLTFNACVICHIELERARQGGPCEAKTLKTLRLALQLARAPQLSPKKVLERLRDPAQRYPFDLLLSTFIWCPEATDAKAADWLAVLGATGPGSLHALLSAGEYRSHPSELIARHAGEVLRAHGAAEAAADWLRLGLGLASGASAATTLERVSRFTKHIGCGGQACGAAGSITNPRFEYR